MASLHGFRVEYQIWNRSERRLSGRCSATVQARSCWGALRAWWRIQRQYKSLVKVIVIRPAHTQACHVELPATWVYGCDHS